MKKYLIALVASAVMAAPAAYAQTAQTAHPNHPDHADSGRMEHRGPGDHMRMMKELGLSEAQEAQVKAIHAKYEPQMKTAETAAKPNMDAMRAAREKGDTAAMNAARASMRTTMAPMTKLRDQEMADVRAILTPDQQKKFDAMAAEHKGMGHGMGQGMHHPAPPPAN